MNKFIGEKEEPIKNVKKKPVKKEIEVIKKGQKEFVICPKCGWQHKLGEKECRFCGCKDL